MRNARFRRTLAAAAASVAALGLTACGTSFDAATNQQYQAGIGADSRETAVQALGTLIVANEDGTGTFSTALLNSTDEVQQLTGITVEDNEGRTVQVTASEAEALDLPVNLAVRLGVEDSKVFFLDDVEGGYYYTVTLSFAGLDDVVIEVPSVVRDSVYADVVAPAAAQDQTADADEAAEEGAAAGINN